MKIGIVHSNEASDINMARHIAHRIPGTERVSTVEQVAMCDRVIFIGSADAWADVDIYALATVTDRRKAIVVKYRPAGGHEVAWEGRAMPPTVPRDRLYIMGERGTNSADEAVHELRQLLGL